METSPVRFDLTSRGLDCPNQFFFYRYSVAVATVLWCQQHGNKFSCRIVSSIDADPCPSKFCLDGASSRRAKRNVTRTVYRGGGAGETKRPKRNGRGWGATAGAEYAQRSKHSPPAPQAEASAKHERETKWNERVSSCRTVPAGERTFLSEN